MTIKTADELEQAKPLAEPFSVNLKTIEKTDAGYRLRADVADGPCYDETKPTLEEAVADLAEAFAAAAQEIEAFDQVRYRVTPLLDACSAAILFNSPSVWDIQKSVAWHRLTGKVEATAEVLVEYIGKKLEEATEC